MNTSPQPITDVSVFLATHADKELLRLAVVGSVDDGKSTLIGRLLYECDGLFEDQISAVRKATAKRAAALEGTNGTVGPLAKGLQNAAHGELPGEELDFSLFTDGLKAEREQGITIDVAYRYFSTPRRKVIVADTPGHIQYTRNMATGASTADAAVILADARLGVLPQTRRHAYIASLLGIPYLAVAVNKMDMVDFDRAVFERIGRELADFARPLGFTQIRLFPVSARQGDNITQLSTRTPWHEGGTLLAWLESLPHQRHLDAAPLRFPVQYVLRPHQDYRGFAGQIASGSVRVGDEVMVLPSQRRTRVTAIDTFEGSHEQQRAPHSVTLRLADEVDISRGDVITHVEQPPAVLNQLEAMLVWFGEQPLDRSRRYLVKHTTRTVPTTIEQVLWRMDLENLSEVPAESLSLNDIGKVHLVCKRPLLCDAYRDNRRTGSFIVIDALTHDTVAAGMILGPAGARAGRAQVGSLVTAQERHARLGQTGGVFLLPETPDAEEQAFQLERRLFDLGRHVTVVRGDTEVALALAETGLFVLFHSTAPQAHRALRDHGFALTPSASLEGWVDQVLKAQERHQP